jgi:DNA-binding transcriptional ArsR family regulator
MLEADEMAKRREATTAPAARRTIGDVETLRALSDPLRLRLMELAVSRPGEPWTAKELAAGLGVPQTRLYHHLDLLVERDLLRVAGERVVSGIIERRYQPVALSFELDRALLGAGAAGESARRELVSTVFDQTRAELESVLAARDDATDAGTAVVARTLARLTPDRAAELRDRLAALLADFSDADAEATAAAPHALVVAFYPRPVEDPAR